MRDHSERIGEGSTQSQEQMTDQQLWIEAQRVAERRSDPPPEMRDANSTESSSRRGNEIIEDTRVDPVPLKPEEAARIRLRELAFDHEARDIANYRFTSEGDESAERPIKRERYESLYSSPEDIARIRTTDNIEGGTERLSEEARLETAVLELLKIEWLRPEKWQILDSTQRRIALERAGNALMIAYECPDPPIFPKELTDTQGCVLRGFYEDGATISNPKGDYGIWVNERLLSLDDPRKALETYIHEYRHAYQHQMVAGYEKNFQVSDPEAAAIWRENFRNYEPGPPKGMNSDDPKFERLFNTYENQEVEKDARVFSKDIVGRLYNGL